MPLDTSFSVLLKLNDANSLRTPAAPNQKVIFDFYLFWKKNIFVLSSKKCTKSLPTFPIKLKNWRTRIVHFSLQMGMKWKYPLIFGLLYQFNIVKKKKRLYETYFFLSWPCSNEIQSSHKKIDVKYKHWASYLCCCFCFF